jgi:hypothetical protein
MAFWLRAWLCVKWRWNKQTREVKPNDFTQCSSMKHAQRNSSYQHQICESCHQTFPLWWAELLGYSTIRVLILVCYIFDVRRAKPSVILEKRCAKMDYICTCSDWKCHRSVNKSTTVTSNWVCTIYMLLASHIFYVITLPPPPPSGPPPAKQLLLFHVTCATNR